MSRMSQHIIEQEEAGKLEYNDDTRQYEPVDTTECSYCLEQTAEPIEDSSGDPMCLDCYTSRRDFYKDAIDGMFHDPMKVLGELGARS